MFGHNASRSRNLSLSVSLGVLIAALPAAAFAQQGQSAASSTSATAGTQASPASQPAPAAAPTRPSQTQTATPGGDDTTTVTITAEKPILEHKIDRDVYDVKQDPTAATGSAADVLNNVPAVTVDNDGTVSLRGNSGVQVLVNGKKSAQMQGDNRAFTLQSL